MGAAAKVTSKGQITIPVEIRKQYGIEPGDRVVFFADLEGHLRFFVRRRRQFALDPLLAWDGPPIPDAAFDPGLPDDELAALLSACEQAV